MPGYHIKCQDDAECSNRCTGQANDRSKMINCYAAPSLIQHTIKACVDEFVCYPHGPADDTNTDNEAEYLFPDGGKGLSLNFWAL
jgi:hypothetical protein